MKRAQQLATALMLGGVLAFSAVADNTEIAAMIEDGQAKQAVKRLEDKLADNPQNADIYYWLATAQLAQIEDASVFRKPFLAKDAKQNLETALNLNASHVAARVSLARYLLEAPAMVGGSVEEAMAQAELLESYDQAASYRVKADITRAEDDHEAAIEWQRKALAAGEWSWDEQYSTVILAVNWQTQSAPAVLSEARAQVKNHSSEPTRQLALIDYQHGKLAATTGLYLEAGKSALENYLTFTPTEGDPDSAWASFRLAQVERYLGLEQAAEQRLAQLESRELEQDLSYAVRDERRWHYSD